MSRKNLTIITVGLPATGKTLVLDAVHKLLVSKDLLTAEEQGRLKDFFRNSTYQDSAQPDHESLTISFDVA